MKTNTLKKQTGAVGLMMAAMMLVLVLFTALALDTARLHYQQQALQSVADIAALEVSRANPYFIAEDNSELAQTLETKYQNEGEVDSLSILTGAAKLSEGKWVFEKGSVSEDVPYSAAKVIVERTVPRSMIASGFFDKEEVTLTAQAAIQQTGVVNIGIGTELVNISTEESPLLNPIFSDLLGTSINISGVGYKGLFDTKVKIGALINSINVVSPEAILESELQLGRISELIDVDSEVAPLLDSLSDLKVKVGDIIDLSPGREAAALGTSLSVLEIIRASVYAANKEHGIDISDVGIELLSLVESKVSLKIIEPPQFTTIFLPINSNDEASVETAQVDLSLQTDVKLSILSITQLNLDVIGAKSVLKVVGEGESDKGKYINLELIRSVGMVQAKLTAILGLVSADIQLGVNNNSLPELITVDLSEVTAEQPLEIAVSSNNGISFSIEKVEVNLLGILPLDLKAITNALTSLINLVFPILNLVGVSLNQTTIWVQVSGSSQFGLIE